MTVTQAAGDLITLVNSGLLMAALTLLIRNERRFTRLETEMQFVLQALNIQKRSTDRKETTN